MFVYETGYLMPPRYIINFPTKRHWRGKSRMEDIEAGLTDLIEVIRAKNIYSIALPPLGSGLGGLNWSEVKKRIEKKLGGLTKVQIIIFEPINDSADQPSTHAANIPHLTPGRAALIGLVNRYLEGLLDPFVTLLEVHKLMYFMQEAGEPLRLKYVKANYGPYAENLRHVLNALEGYFIAGYADGGDAPDKQLAIVPGAKEEATATLSENSETLQRFNRVTALVDGFESPFGLELLATVHWVMQKEHCTDVDRVIECVYTWDPRKSQFTPRQVRMARERLLAQHWVNQ
jgi:O-acetyl-ADP-ribose deacetylase (regulator of RNase III)